MYRLITCGRLYDCEKNTIDTKTIEEIVTNQYELNPMIVAKELGYLFIYLVSVGFFLCTNTIVQTEHEEPQIIHLSSCAPYTFPSPEKIIQEAQDVVTKHISTGTPLFLSSFLTIDLIDLSTHISEALHLLNDTKTLFQKLDSNGLVPLSSLEDPFAQAPSPTSSEEQIELSKQIKLFELPQIHSPGSEHVLDDFSPDEVHRDTIYASHTFSLTHMHQPNTPSLASLSEMEQEAGFVSHPILSLINTSLTRVAFFSSFIEDLTEYLQIPLFSEPEYLSLVSSLKMVYLQTMNALKLCHAMSAEMFIETQKILKSAMLELENKLLLAYQARLSQLSFPNRPAVMTKAGNPIKVLISEWMSIAETVPKKPYALQSFIVNTGLVCANALIHYSSTLANILNPSVPVVEHLIDMAALTSSFRSRYSTPSQFTPRRRTIAPAFTTMSSPVVSYYHISPSPDSIFDMGPIPTFSPPPVSDFFLRQIPESVSTVLSLQQIEDVDMDPTEFLKVLQQTVIHAKTIFQSNDPRQKLLASLNIAAKKLNDSVKSMKAAVQFKIVSHLTQWRTDWNAQRDEQQMIPIFQNGSSVQAMDNEVSEDVFGSKFMDSVENAVFNDRESREKEVPWMDVGVTFLNYPFELIRIHRLVRSNRSIQHLLPSKTEIVQAILFTESYEELVDIITKIDSAFSDLPHQFARLFRVPILFLMRMGEYDVLKMSYHDPLTESIFDIGPSRTLIFNLHQQITNMMLAIDSQIMSLARLNFAKSSSETTLESHENAGETGISKMLQYAQDTSNSIIETLHDVFNLTLTTINTLCHSYNSIVKKDPSVPVEQTLLSTFDQSGQDRFEPFVFYGNKGVFETYVTETRRIVEAYWGLYINALHHSMLTTFRYLTFLFTPTITREEIDEAKAYPQMEVHVTFVNNTFRIVPTSVEVTNFLTKAVSKFNLFLNFFPVWDFDYLAKHWRVFQEGPSRIATPTMPNVEHTVWTEVSSSLPLIKETFIYLGSVPHIPPVTVSLMNRFGVLDPFLRLDQDEIFRKLPLLLHSTPYQKDFTTFALPTSFTPIIEEERRATELELVAELENHTTQSIFRKLISSANLMYHVVPSSFVADDTSPFTFYPDERPYICSLCHCSFGSLVSYTNHIHANRSHHTELENQTVILQALKQYLIRSMERIALWKELIIQVNAQFGNQKNPLIPEPTKVVNISSRFKSILVSLFSPVQLTYTIQINFTSMFLGQVYELIDTTFKNYERQYINNIELYSARIAAPLLNSLVDINLVNPEKTEHQHNTTVLLTRDTMNEVSMMMKQIEAIAAHQSTFEQNFAVLEEFITDLVPLCPSTAKKLRSNSLQLVRLNEQLLAVSSIKPILLTKQSQISEQLLTSSNTMRLSLDVLCLGFDSVKTLFETAPSKIVSVANRQQYIVAFLTPAFVHAKYLHDMNKQVSLLGSPVSSHHRFMIVCASLRYYCTLFHHYPHFLNFVDQLRQIRFNDLDKEDQYQRFSHFRVVLERLQTIRVSVSPPLQRSHLHKQFKAEVHKLKVVFQTLFPIDQLEFKPRHWVQLATDLNLLDLLNSTVSQNDGTEKSPKMGAILDSDVHKRISAIISVKGRARIEAKIEEQLTNIQYVWENENKLLLTPKKHTIKFEANIKLEGMDYSAYVVKEDSIRFIIHQAQRTIDELQSLSSSKHSHPFIKRIQKILSTLLDITAPLTQFMKAQRIFILLLNFFSSSRNSSAVQNPYNEFLGSCYIWNHILLEIKHNPAPFHSFVEGKFIRQVLTHTYVQFQDILGDLDSFIDAEKRTFPILNLLPEDHVIALLSYVDSPADFQHLLPTILPNTTSFSYTSSPQPLETILTSTGSPHIVADSFSPHQITNEGSQPFFLPTNPDAVFTNFDDLEADLDFVQPNDAMTRRDSIAVSPANSPFSLQLGNGHPPKPNETLNFAPMQNSFYNSPHHTSQSYLVDGVYGTLGEYLHFHTPIKFVPGGDNVRFLVEIRNAVRTVVKTQSVNALFSFPTAFFPEVLDKKLTSTELYKTKKATVRMSQSSLEHMDPVGMIVSLFVNLASVDTQFSAKDFVKFLQDSIAQSVFFAFYSVWSYLIHFQLNTLSADLSKNLYFEDFIKDDSLGVSTIDAFLKNISNRHDSPFTFGDGLNIPIELQMKMIERFLVKTVKVFQGLVRVLRSPLEIVKAEQAILATLNVLSVFSFFHHYPIGGRSISFETCGYIITTLPVTIVESSSFITGRTKELYGHLLEPPISIPPPPPILTGVWESPYDATKATVYFDTAEVQYGFEYLGLKMSTLDSWNIASRINPPKQFDDAIHNETLTLFFRSTEFWTNVARCIQSISPPSFNTQQSSKKGDVERSRSFAIISGISPFYVFDRLHEFGAICGKNIRHLMLSTETVSPNTLPEFISAIVTYGMWGVVEGLSNLSENFVASLSSILSSLLDATRDNLSSIQFPDGNHVKITSGFYLFTATVSSSEVPELPTELRRYFHSVTAHSQHIAHRLYVHFTLDGLLYAYQITERVEALLEELRSGIIHSSLVQDGLITHLCHNVPTYLELIAKSILPSIEALEGISNLQLLHPLLLFLKKMSTMDNQDFLSSDASLSSSSNYRQLKDKLSDIFTFVVENLAVATCLWEYLRVFLSEDELPGMMCILLASFPEIGDIYSDNIENPTQSLQQNAQDASQWYLKGISTEIKYQEELSEFIAHLFVGPISYNSMYPSILEGLTTLTHESLPIIDQFVALVERTTGHDEVSKFTEALSFMSEDTPEMGSSQKSSGKVVVQSLFEQNILDSDRVYLEASSADVTDDKLKYYSPREASKTEDRVIFDQLAAVHTNYSTKNIISSHFMDLDNALHHPLWTASPLTKRSITSDSPLILVGPPGCGKTFMMHILSLAQNAKGINAKIIHLNPSTLSRNELYGSFTSGANLITDTIGSDTFPLRQDVDEHIDIFESNPGFTFEGSIRKTTKPRNRSLNNQKMVWNRGIVEILADQIARLGDKSNNPIYFIIDSSLSNRSSPTTYAGLNSSTSRAIGRETRIDRKNQQSNDAMKWGELLYPLLSHSTRLEDHIKRSLYLSFIRQAAHSEYFRQTGLLEDSASNIRNRKDSLFKRAVSVLLANDPRFEGVEDPEYYPVFSNDYSPGEETLLDSLHDLHRSIRSLSLSNNNRVSFPPSVRFIIETDSLENIPYYLLRSCRILTVPSSLLIHPVVSLSTRSLTSTDPRYARAFLYVTQIVSSQYILHRPVSASYLFSPRFICIMYKTISNAVTLFLHWLRIAYDFLQSCTVPDPRRARVVIDRSAVDNHIERFFLHSLTLFTTIFVTLIDKISLAIASENPHKGSHGQPETIDWTHAIENSIVYSLYWGTGGHLFHIHEFRQLYSDRLCALLSKPPIFTQGDTFQHMTSNSTVREDVRAMNGYLDLENHGLYTRESLYSYCVNSMDGTWLTFNRLLKKQKQQKEQLVRHQSHQANLSAPSQYSGLRGKSTLSDSTLMTRDAFMDIMSDMQLMIAPYSHVISLYLSSHTSIMLGYTSADMMDIISQSIVRTPHTHMSSLDNTYQLFDLNVTSRTTVTDFHRLLAQFREKVSRSRQRFINQFETTLTQITPKQIVPNSGDSVSTENHSIAFTYSEQSSPLNRPFTMSTHPITANDTSITYDEINRSVGAMLLHISLSTPLPEFILSEIRSIINKTTMVLNPSTDTCQYTRDTLSLIVTVPRSIYTLLPHRFAHKLPLITTPSPSVSELLFIFNRYFSQKLQSIITVGTESIELPQPYLRVPSITLMLCMFLGCFQVSMNSRHLNFFRHMLPSLLLFPPTIKHGLEILSLICSAIATNPQIKGSRAAIAIEWIKSARDVFGMRCSQAEKVRLDLIIVFFGSHIIDSSSFEIRRLRALIRHLCTYDTLLGEEILFLEEHKSEDYHRFIQLYDSVDVSMGQYLQRQNNPFVLSTFNESTGIRLFRVKKSLERHHVFLISPLHLITQNEVGIVVSMTGYANYHLRIKSSLIHFLDQLRSIIHLLLETDRHVVVSLFIDDVASLDKSMSIYRAHQQESSRPLISQQIPGLSQTTTKAGSIRGSERIQCTDDRIISHTTPNHNSLTVKDVSDYLLALVSSSTFVPMIFSENEVQAMNDHLLARDIIPANATLHTYLQAQIRTHLRLLFVAGVVEPSLETDTVVNELRRHLSPPMNSVGSSPSSRKSPRIPPQKAHTSAIMYSPCLDQFEWFIENAHFVRIDNLPFNSLVRKAFAYVPPRFPVKLAYHAKKATKRKGKGEEVFPFVRNDLSDYLLTLGGSPIDHLNTNLSLTDRFWTEDLSEANEYNIDIINKPEPKHECQPRSLAIDDIGSNPTGHSRQDPFPKRVENKPTFPPLTHPPVTQLPIGPGLLTTYTIRVLKTKPSLSSVPTARRILPTQSSQANLYVIRPLTRSSSQLGLSSSYSLYQQPSFQIDDDDDQWYTKSVSPLPEEPSFPTSPSPNMVMEQAQRNNTSYRRMQSLVKLEMHSFDNELELRLRDTLMTFTDHSDNFDLIHSLFDQSRKALDEFYDQVQKLNLSTEDPKSEKMLNSMKGVGMYMIRPLVLIFNTMKTRCDYFSLSFTSTTSVTHRVPFIPNSFLPKLVHTTFEIAVHRLQKLVDFRQTLVNLVNRYHSHHQHLQSEPEHIETQLNGDSRLGLKSNLLKHRYNLCKSLVEAQKSQHDALQKQTERVFNQFQKIQVIRCELESNFQKETLMEHQSLADIRKRLTPSKFDGISKATVHHRASQAILQMVQILCNIPLEPVTTVLIRRNSMQFVAAQVTSFPKTLSRNPPRPLSPTGLANQDRLNVSEVNWHFFKRGEFVNILKRVTPDNITGEQVELLQPLCEIIDPVLETNRKEVGQLGMLYTYMRQLMQTFTLQHKYFPTFHFLIHELATLESDKTVLEEMQITASNVMFTIESIISSMKMGGYSTSRPTLARSQRHLKFSPNVRQSPSRTSPASPQVQQPRKLMEDPLYVDIMTSWLSMIDCVDRNIVDCFGDSVLAATFATFQATMNYDEWEWNLNAWKDILKAMGISFSDEFPIAQKPAIDPQTPFPIVPSALTIDVVGSPYDFSDQLAARMSAQFVRPMYRPIWAVLKGPSSFFKNQIQGVPPDEYLVLSSLVAQSGSEQTVQCIIDPTGTAAHIVMNSLRIKTHVVFTNILSTSFFSDAIDALLSGHPLLVEYVDPSVNLNGERASALLRMMDQLIECAQGNPLQDITISGKTIALKQGFRLFVFLRGEVTLVPHHFESFLDSLSRHMCTIVNWAPFTVARTFGTLLQHSIILPMFDSNVLLRRKRLLSSIPAKFAQAHSHLDDLVSHISVIRVSTFHHLSKLSSSYHDSLRLANQTVLQTLGEVMMTQKEIESQPALQAFVKDLYSVNQLFTRVNIERWLNKMTLKNIIIQPFRQTGALSSSTFFTALFDAIAYMLRHFALSSSRSSAESGSENELQMMDNIKKFSHIEKLSQAGKSQSGIRSLRQFFHVEGPDQKPQFDFDLNVMNERLMSMLFENVSRSILMFPSSNAKTTIPLPHTRALNFLMSYNTNIRIFIHRGRMLQPPPGSFTPPPYISHPFTYLISLDDTFIPRLEYQLPFFTMHTSHFKDLFNTSVSFLSDIVGTEEDEIIHTRFVTLTSSSIRQTMKVLDKLIATRKNPNSAEDPTQVGFEESFRTNREAWVNLMNHPHPVTEPLPNDLDNMLLPLERFIIFRQFIPHEAMNCLLQMSEVSITIANLPPHPLETVIRRSILMTHPTTLLYLVAPIPILDLDMHINYVVRTTYPDLPSITAPPLAVATIPASAESGQHTVVDFLAPLNIVNSFSLWGPIPNSSLTLPFSKAMIDVATTQLRNPEGTIPHYFERMLYPESPSVVANQHWRSTRVEPVISSFLLSVLNSSFFTHRFFLTADQFTIPVSTYSLISPQSWVVKHSFETAGNNPSSRFPARSQARHRRQFSGSVLPEMTYYRNELQKYVVRVSISQNALKRHSAFVYSKSHLRNKSNNPDLSRDSLLLTNNRFPIYPRRKLASTRLILLRKEQSMGEHALYSSSSHVCGTVRHFPRNWEQLEFHVELAEVIGWIPHLYEFQPSIPVWGRFCFNLSVVFALFSLRLKARRLFLSAQTGKEGSLSESSQNGISIEVENEMMSQATFIRLLRNSHSLVETVFKTHLGTVRTLSSGNPNFTDERREQLFNCCFASLFMELKTTVLQEFLPHIPPSSPDIEALLHLLNAYFGKNMFDPQFDYLHPDGIIDSSDPNKFTLPKSHSGELFVRREVINLVNDGIPLRSGTKLMGLEQMLMDASTITIMNRTYSLVQSLLMHSKTQRTRENLLPTIDPTEPDVAGESPVAEVIQHLPPTGHYFDYLNFAKKLPNEGQVFTSFVVQECILMDLVNSQFQTSIVTQNRFNQGKSVNGGVYRETDNDKPALICHPSIINSLPLPPHVCFSMSDIASWIQERHVLINQILHSPNFMTVFDIALFHYPGSFLTSAKYAFYNEVITDHKKGLFQAAEHNQCNLTLSRRFLNNQMEKPNIDNIGLKSIHIPSVFTPPFPLPVTVTKFHPNVYPFSQALLSITFVPLDPSMGNEEILRTVSNSRLSHGAYMTGIGMYGFGFNFETNRFVQMTANGMLPPSCTQYPLVWVSLSFPSPFYHPNRQYTPFIDLSPFTSPLVTVGMSQIADTLDTQTTRADPYPVPLFSSGALDSRLCDVVVLHEDFIQWHNAGCSLFVDYTPKSLRPS
ncbi:putative Dynein heavy chain, N-terminal region 2 [Blattamonas nauphoetae]|uniref:Dynein heavy chain, N-terminal region 2 n=1 Tax=Blattamonas nauphoetae TaxID=2049346 RepID=A0ABQ9XCK1_9EUKA|nr:putative Dynein heavy chain, N-terminal region 2 [Blattamonas nauphoetae]